MTLDDIRRALAIEELLLLLIARDHPAYEVTQGRIVALKDAVVLKEQGQI